MATHILLVDDDRNINVLHRTMLERGGFRIETETNPLTALSKIRDQQPDLLILDIMMPEMNGLDLADAVRSEVKSTMPIIFLTAYPEYRSAVADKLDDKTKFLEKPVPFQNLIECVDDTLNRLL